MTKVVVHRSGGDVEIKVGDLVAIDANTLGVTVGIVFAVDNSELGHRKVDVWRATSETDVGGKLYDIEFHRITPIKEVKVTV